jgi:protein-S-isoprenylcysteine O-methyltransferase Ste14
MLRRLVQALFVLMAVAASASAVRHGARILDDPNLRTAAVAGYALLKAAVAVAFAVFVLRRQSARERTFDPVAIVSCAAAMGSVVLLRAPGADVQTLAVVSGDVIALAAGAWMLISILTLRECFGVLPEVRGLVTSGPYSRVRHPLYLGEFGAVAGLLVASATRWNIALAAIFIIAQAVRMRLEERALSAAFPEYAAYADATPRLIPRLVDRPARAAMTTR